MYFSWLVFGSLAEQRTWNGFVKCARQDDVDLLDRAGHFACGNDAVAEIDTRQATVAATEDDSGDEQGSTLTIARPTSPAACSNTGRRDASARNACSAAINALSFLCGI